MNVQKEGEAFVWIASERERIAAGTGLIDREARRQLLWWLTRAGVSKALKKAGVKPGDRVRLGELEWEW